MRWTSRIRFVFLLPAVVWVLVFTIFPLGYSLYLAFYKIEQRTEVVRSTAPMVDEQGKPVLDPAVLAGPEDNGTEGGAGLIDDDLFDQAARLVVQERQASASFLQRRMRVGFSRAARLIDMMEREGLLGPAQGSKPRDVLVPPDYFTEVDETTNR